MAKFKEGDYVPITPKVGEKYRVVKAMTYLPGIKLGDVVEMKDSEHTTKGHYLGGPSCGKDYRTTEYLEKVAGAPEEGGWLGKVITEFDQYKTIQKIEAYIDRNYETPKQYTMTQTLTSALKRALNKDKQTLYKAGYINGGLELSSTGREAYVNALFQNDGDHAKAVAEMVAQAEEELKEQK